MKKERFKLKESIGKLNKEIVKSITNIELYNKQFLLILKFNRYKKNFVSVTPL